MMETSFFAGFVRFITMIKTCSCIGNRAGLLGKVKRLIYIQILHAFCLNSHAATLHAVTFNFDVACISDGDTATVLSCANDGVVKNLHSVVQGGAFGVGSANYDSYARCTVLATGAQSAIDNHVACDEQVFCVCALFPVRLGAYVYGCAGASTEETKAVGT